MRNLILLLSVFAFRCSGATSSKAWSLLTPIVPHPNAVNLSPGSAAANPTSTCSDQLLNYCHIRFNELLNITTEDWRNFDKFVADVRAILSRGVQNGLLKLCSARTQYYGCLGVSYDDCMSRFHFLRQGHTFEEAIEYVEIFGELEFMCNGGLLQTIRNWECIETVENDPNKMSQFQYCREIYTNTTRDHPDQACLAGQAFLQCVRFFISTCGQEAGWWECEMNRVALELATYCPQLSCSYSMFQLEAPVSSNRHELFRSPNPYFMPKYKQELFARLAGKAIERAKRKKRSIE